MAPPRPSVTPPALPRTPDIPPAPAPDHPSDLLHHSGASSLHDLCKVSSLLLYLVNFYVLIFSFHSPNWSDYNC